MFRKLRNKMLLFNMVTLFTVIVATFFVVYITTYENIQSETNHQLKRMSDMTLSQRDPEFRENNNNNNNTNRFGADYRVSFVLVVQDGEIRSITSRLDYDASVYEEALEMADEKPKGKITLEGREWAYMTSDIQLSQSEECEKIVFMDITDEVQTLKNLLTTLVWVGIAVLLILLWISYIFSQRAVRPIEESYEKQKQFIADASHELKTPLAVISANIDAIESSASETVESQKEWFSYIREELGRSAKLVEDMLYLAKADNIRSDTLLPCDISGICETVCASVEAVLYENGICLEMQIAENVIIYADEEKIKQVLYILFDNAGKYTPEGGKVRFVLSTEQEYAVVRISNTGQDIAPEDLSRIFDRFYRPDTSRSQETGGSGLGLSIAKTIVERSKGKISAESGDGVTTFTIQLKRNP
ncbi:MAG: sensor histidine kinase [Porcipelethomonas sp.]